jgi:hypothetical protein
MNYLPAFMRFLIYRVLALRLKFSRIISKPSHYFSFIYINTTLPKSPKLSVPCRFSDQKFMCVSSFH